MVKRSREFPSSQQWQAPKPKSYFDVAPKLYEANPPPGTYDAKGLADVSSAELLLSTSFSDRWSNISNMAGHV